MPDRLVRLLVNEGALSAADGQSALRRQAETGGTIDTSLLELGLLDESRLGDALSRASGVPPAPAAAFGRVDPRSRRLFPSKVAERHGLAPFAAEGRELSLAAEYPMDAGLLDEVGFMLSLYLKPHVAPAWRVRELIHQIYGTPVPPRLAALAERVRSRERAAGSVAGAAPTGQGLAPTQPRPEPLAAALAQAVEGSEAQEILGEPARAAARPPAERSAPPRWSLDQARAFLAATRSRDEVVLVALRYARDFFDYAAMFAVTRDAIWGHDALGPEEGAREACRGVAVAIEEPGFFGPAIETAGPYLGPVAPGPASDAVLKGLGRGAPRTVLLYPVVVGDRPVCVLYADNGEAPVSPRRLGDLLLLASSLGAALERVIRQRKAGGRPGAAVGEPWKATEPGLAEPALPGSVEVDLGDFEVGSPAKVLAAPPDLDAGAAVERLAASARGSPERGSLIAQLVQRGAEAARFLCARLPGPIEVKSQALAEATPVYEQGPILAALAALGTPATADLLAVLADPDPERRRYAVLTLGHIADPAAIAGLAERVFDPDPRVAAAARGASAALRREPQMRPVVEGLRQALVSASPERAAQAARALARLGDAEAVPLLIQLLEAGDRAADGAAAEALTRITMQRLGESPGRWLGWWHENRGAPRASWLFAALSDPDREVRAAAAEELRAAGLPPVAYIADAPLAEREQAARAWAAWWESTGMTI